MKKVLSVFAIMMILSLTLLAKCTQENSNEFTINEDLKKQLDYACEKFVNVNYISGGVYMIARNGKMIYQNAFGMQSREDNEKMKFNTIFRIASMTKPVTTVALLKLVEKGVLNLDDEAGKYLPQFNSIKVELPDGTVEQPKRSVSIRHLLMHTSGTRSRIDPWFRENNINPNSAETLEEYVNLLLKAPLKFHPHEGFNYAMNNDIAARIVEIVTGKNYGDYLRESVLEPLEMNSTFYIVPESELNRLTSIYAYDKGKLVLVEGKEPEQSAFPRGNGQMVSTAGDYMNFLQMLLDGGVFKGKRLLKEETLKLMTEDNLPEDVRLQVGNTYFPNTGFGLSVAISRRKSNPWTPIELKFSNLFQHLPEGSYLWPGITNTFFWVDPVNKITGIVLSQSRTPGLMANFQEFTQTFYKGFFNLNESESMGLGKEEATKEVWDTEIEFSKKCAKLGIYEATTVSLADDAVLFKPGPVNGLKYQNGNKPEPIFIKTYPESVEASQSGDLGFVTGYWEYSGTKPDTPLGGFGLFSTVWQRLNSGEWKVICANAVGGIKAEDFKNYKIGNKWEEVEFNESGENASINLKESDAKLNSLITANDNSLKIFYLNKHQVLQSGKLPSHITENEIKGESWKTIESKISEAGDMGFSYGSFNYIAANKEGYYLRFWKMDLSNNWKIFMDLYN